MHGSAGGREKEAFHTIKYPPTHPVTVIPIATDTLADPNTLLITVGMVEKKPPFATPLIIAKAIIGPIESDNGHSTSILTALSRRELNSVFSGPMVSQHNPQIRRPMAEEKLKAATTPAPVPDDIPKELVKRGKKKGGTKRGKVAIPLATKRMRNRISRNSFLCFFISSSANGLVVMMCCFLFVGFDLPLDQRSRRDWDALFDEPRCWQSSDQSSKANDAKCPFRTYPLDQLVHGEADNCAAKATTCVNYTVGDTSFIIEVLRWCNRDNLTDKFN